MRLAHYNSDIDPDVDLEGFNLLRYFGGRWQYKFGIDGNWMTANSKEDAVARASRAYRNTPIEDRLTRDQRDTKADAAEYAISHQRYGTMSIDQLLKKHRSMGHEIEILQRSCHREFDCGSGRRTGAAVSAEGARTIAMERARLGRYIERRSNEGIKP